MSVNKFSQSPEVQNRLKELNINPNTVKFLKRKYELQLNGNKMNKSVEAYQANNSTSLIPINSHLDIDFVPQLEKAPRLFREQILKNGIKIRGILFPSN